MAGPSANAEFTAGGHNYRVGPLNLLEQNSVARRLSSALIPLSNLRAAADPRPSDEDVARAFCAMTSSIPSEIMDEAVRILLSCLLRDHGGGKGWAKFTAPNGMVMFDDVDIPTLNLLLIKVLDAYRIIDFFVDRLSGSPALGTVEAPNG